uniref:Uncharacterized protein n=1 Tax=Elaeophora elaphi TaxID=1147741 RepID=A0A0R3RKT9_9BILA
MSPRSIHSKWKSLKRCKRSRCSSNNFSGNQDQTVVSENNEAVKEFITPPLCTIPGIELESKLQECGPKTLSVRYIFSQIYKARFANLSSLFHGSFHIADTENFFNIVRIIS